MHLFMLACKTSDCVGDFRVVEIEMFIYQREKVIFLVAKMPVGEFDKCAEVFRNFLPELNYAANTSLRRWRLRNRPSGLGACDWSVLTARLGR